MIPVLSRPSIISEGAITSHPISACIIDCFIKISTVSSFKISLFVLSIHVHFTIEFYMIIFSLNFLPKSQGNNKCIIYRGQRLNHRILRYAYYVSQLKKNLKLNQNLS